MATGADTPSSRSNKRRGERVSFLEKQRQRRKTATEKQKPKTPVAAQLVVQPDKSPTRVIVVWAILLAAGLGLAFNLYGLQIKRGQLLRSQARQQQMVSLRPFVPRRPIVDRSGNVLAIDRPVYALYAHPRLFKKPKEAVAAAVAPLLNRNPDELVKLFNSAETGIRLENTLLEEAADRVANLRLDGLELVKLYARFYPQQDLAADVVGYVNLDHKGQAGLEYSQEKLLERFVRSVRLSRAGNGAVMPDRVPSGLLNFDDLRLQLTIDSRLQRSARSALKQQLEQFKAKRGTVLVMDARDGSLLALASEPSYDPNQYSQYNVELYKNWALTDLYEPGSTFKPINVAIALEAGTIKPDTQFFDEGQITIGSSRISNFDGRGHGSISITDILKYSSNIGMVHIIQTLRPTVYYGWLERLGLNQPVETDLPFSTPGLMKPQEMFTSAPIYPANAAFGQGFSLTPLHLLEFHAALANGGKLVSPHIVRGLTDAKGQLYWQPNLPAPRPIFSPATTKAVIGMMEAVVKEGTGKRAQIEGYRIAGKTGTAQKASPTGGYSSSAKITSFVGILPVESPKYVVLAVVDEPKGGSGSSVAAPIVRAVMESLINIERLPPSMPADTKQ